MNQRIITMLSVLAAVAAVTAVACVDMSAPSGAASISTLQLPSPSIVVGDVMRDSTGAPAPLAIIAYDANGTPITGLAAQFFLADTLHYAHLDATNQLVGDKIGTTSVRGQIGSLQTSAVSVPVTYAPSHIRITTKTDSLDVPVAGDSATSIGSISLPVGVLSVQDSAAQGFIVKYTITHAPATLATAKSPAVYLVSDAGQIASADTSDVSGVASPKLVVNSSLLAQRDTLLAHTVAHTPTDSVVIEASSKYKGVLLAGSPLRFVIKLTLTVKL